MAQMPIVDLSDEPTRGAILDIIGRLEIAEIDTTSRTDRQPTFGISFRELRVNQTELAQLAMFLVPEWARGDGKEGDQS